MFISKRKRKKLMEEEILRQKIILDAEQRKQKRKAQRYEQLAGRK